MPVDHIRYDLLVREALRGVVRRVVADVAKNGLPGDHHFYIAFDTRAPGVRLSQRLRDQYPHEMTIVLQHQFWDLTVDEHGFEVGLSFGGIPERLAVPFEAIKGFFDPSVQFGLEFEVASGAGEADDKQAAPPAAPAPAALPATAPVAAQPLRAARENPRRDGSSPAKGDESKAPPGDDSTPKPTGGGEVVRIDRFRKK
ncbi:MAG: Stringent starvation protein B [Variibacter sp.]|nr:Stringent starvation protein B [Variibacter sp.]